MFGSMFLKTLRVYRIFTARNRPLLHSKVSSSLNLNPYPLILLASSRLSSAINLLLSLWYRPSHHSFLANLRSTLREIRLWTSTIISPSSLH